MLFESKQQRERDYVKTIFHRIYGRFKPKRPKLRQIIGNECYRYIYGNDKDGTGIEDFLEIYC